MEKTTKARIVDAAVAILEERGIEGLTTRAVCNSANVTAPTLYHHFGDRNGLLAAVLEDGIQALFSRKRSLPLTDDPVADLRKGWENWIGFFLERPNLLLLMEEGIRADSAVLQEMHTIMLELVERVDSANRLNHPPTLAANVIWAASQGVVKMFIQGKSKKDIEATATLLFDSIFDQLVD